VGVPAERIVERPRATDALVRVEGVSKTFRDGELETHVLDATGFELEQGQTVSLVGVSGSGKSTLISLLSGLLRPDSGRVVFDGHDFSALDDRARAELRAGRIGVVLQSGNLVPFLTAQENVKLAIELADGRRAGTRARDLLKRFGLGGRIDHLPRRLSGGEAQRVAVAMALANDPDLLLADEATGELDSASADNVMSIIFDAWRERGLTVLYVTHSTELAARAQRRLQLTAGKVHDA
jgi:putative ABC transport system ATP-binding protein